MSDEDMLIRRCILQISCQGELSSELLQQVATRPILDALVDMEKEGILYLYDGGMIVTAAGEPFIRNICGVFDERMSAKPGQPLFSKAI